MRVVGLTEKRWSLILDVLGFRVLSDSQVRDVKEVVACIYLEFMGGSLARIINLKDISDWIP